MPTSDDPFELGISSRPKFMPDSISPAHMAQIFQDVPESVKVYARTLLAQDWRLYAVNQDRGRCYAGSRKVITIPVWCIDSGSMYYKGIGHKIWYVSHELAHAYDACVHNHGPEFMEWLKKICPPEHIHHELGYKPRNAAAAGIMFEL